MRALAEVRTLVIETASLRLELQDTVPVGRRTFEVAVGTEVTFALEKKTVYIRDADDREFRLRVTKQITK